MAVIARPKVVIIVLNWNNWEDSVACLDSLSQISYANYEVVLLDNGSEDDSVERLKEYCENKSAPGAGFVGCYTENPSVKIVTYANERAKTGNFSSNEKMRSLENRLTLIENGKNDGFTGGNNLAITYALKKLNPGYVLLLNNDTVVHRRFLEELVEAAESDRTIGFAGPTIYYCNVSGQSNVINSAGGRVSLSKGTNKALNAPEEGIGPRYQIRMADYVSGACLLVRKQVIEQIGMLDPHYFTYWEDVDWCIRGRKAGYKSVHVPRSRIWHKMDTSKRDAGYYYYRTRNKFWFVRKNGTKREYVTAVAFFFLYEFWVTTGILLLHHKRGVKEFRAFIIGIVDGLREAQQ